MRYADEYGMQGMKVTKKKLLRRLEWLCKFFKEKQRGTLPTIQLGTENYTNNISSFFDNDNSHGGGGRGRRDDNQNTELRDNREKRAYTPRGQGRRGGGIARPLNKFRIQLSCDPNGNIIYPIEITQSLRIESLGVIDYGRPMFHTASNIYPIGYRSVRDHQSCKNPNTRAQYFCEVLERDNRPLFKVTCSDYPDDPIEKDSCSGCWMFFANKIN